MFYGKFNHSLDSKGRLIVPAKFRQKAEEKFFITAGIESCLYGFTEAEWKSFEEKLRALPFTRESARRMVRRFFSMTAETACDKLGRIHLSSSLIEYADISADVYIIGAGARFEIWNRATFDRQDSDGSFEKIAEELADLNIL